MPAKRVLLVDDNAVVRSFVRKLFESQSDFEISGEAENGRDALEKAEKLKPDLIILDLIMPVMTGLDAAPLLKQLLPNTPIILFTQQEGSEVERQAQAAGIDAVVSKSQVASQLVFKAQALLASIEPQTTPPSFATPVRSPPYERSEGPRTAALQVLLDEAGAEVNVHLYQWGISERCETMNLAGLDDKDVSRVAFEGFAAYSP
jgi:NarL family two-component system response regulator LiaR